jgi:hypothetical protein
MSSTLYAQQNPSPVVTSRSQMTIEDIGNSSQRTSNRRSLSGKIRSLFRRDSPSPNRTIKSDRRPPPPPPPQSTTTTTVRQVSVSPASSRPSSEAPHLRAPIVHWPFGKKKTKLSATTSTPTTSKKKIKVSRKKNQAPTPPLEISSPIYQQETQTSIQGQYFTPRTPELVHDSTGRLQSTSSYEALTPSYEVSTKKGFRDYVVIDQSQQSQHVRLSFIESILLVFKEISSYYLSSFSFCV